MRSCKPGTGIGRSENQFQKARNQELRTLRAEVEWRLNLILANLRICPSNLPVHREKRVFSPECSGCMDCTAACPVEKTLVLKTAWPWKKVWSAASLGIVILALFTGLVYSARVTGYWQTSVPEQEFRMLLKNIDSPQLVHPRTQFTK